MGGFGACVRMHMRDAQHTHTTWLVECNSGYTLTVTRLRATSWANGILNICSKNNQFYLNILYIDQNDCKKIFNFATFRRFLTIVFVTERLTIYSLCSSYVKSTNKTYIRVISSSMLLKEGNMHKLYRCF